MQGRLLILAHLLPQRCDIPIARQTIQNPTQDRHSSYLLIWFSSTQKRFWRTDSYSKIPQRFIESGSSDVCQCWQFRSFATRWIESSIWGCAYISWNSFGFVEGRDTKRYMGQIINFDWQKSKDGAQRSHEKGINILDIDGSGQTWPYSCRNSSLLQHFNVGIFQLNRKLRRFCINFALLWIPLNLHLIRSYFRLISLKLRSWR